MHPGRLTLLLCIVAALPASAQLADSLGHLNAAHQWQGTIDLARAQLPTLRDSAQRCQAQLQVALAYDRLGQLDDGAARMQMIQRECRDRLDAANPLLLALKSDLALPPIPTTGLDFSGVDRFYEIVDTLAADREPSETMWHRMWITPGYRLAFFNAQPLREDLELAFRPSRAADRSRTLARNDDTADRIRHLIRAGSMQRELRRYRDSLAQSRVVDDAVALAAGYLPAGTTNSTRPPFVAFALFRDDASSPGSHSVVVDLLRATEGNLTQLLAHEFHHSYLRTVLRMRFPDNDSPDAPLVYSLLSMMAEGVCRPD